MALDTIEDVWNGVRSLVSSDADTGRTRYEGDFRLLNYIPMYYGGIASSHSETPILMTWGISTCLALAGYDPTKNAGFLTHNPQGRDFATNHDEIIHDLHKMYGVRGDDMVFYLTGAIVTNPGKVDTRTLDWVDSARDYVSKNFPHSDIVEDVLDWSFKSNYRAKSFGLDTRDGTVYYVDKRKQRRSLENVKIHPLYGIT